MRRLAFGVLAVLAAGGVERRVALQRARDLLLGGVGNSRPARQQ